MRRVADDTPTNIIAAIATPHCFSGRSLCALWSSFVACASVAAAARLAHAAVAEITTGATVARLGTYMLASCPVLTVPAPRPILAIQICDWGCSNSHYVQHITSIDNIKNATQPEPVRCCFSKNSIRCGESCSHSAATGAGARLFKGLTRSLMTA
jgi:hypothetical protein